MAEISLKDYQNKLERLLVTGTTDEVVHHCRHILQYYPKNVAVYRILGQALINSTGIEEAGEIFRRVLGVYPDDYVAHMSLSDVYQRTGKANEAIWHMERAYEQDPNNKANNDRLRDLYRQYRQVDYPRLQLTTGAVARQYLRNGLHAQAIETLKDTLEQSPNRADLRLLMAQTLWESGDQVESAEAALDVLKKLPDCLEANRILTLLWLIEGRPSDAQRYLSRIETVDPYQAMEIATNNPVADNAFMLPEVDYGSITQRRLATSEPDWLSEINSKSSETTDDWMSGLGATSTETLDEDSFSASVPDDWLQDDEPVKTDDMNDLFAGIQRGVEPSPKVTGGLTGLLAAMESGKDELPPDLFDFDALESELPDEDEGDTLISKAELPDWLAQSAPVGAAEELPPLELEEPDPMAWLQDNGVEITETETPDFFAEDDEIASPDADSDADDVDAFAWLQNSGVEIIENPTVQDFFADEGEMVYQDPSSVNPLAWLEDSGVEVTQSETAQSEELSAPKQEKFNYSDPDAANPLAWLQGSGMELTDSSSQDFQSLSSMLESQSNLDAEDDSLDWLKEESMLDELLDIENLADAKDATPVSPSPAAPLTIEDFLSPSDEEEIVSGDWKGQTDVLAGSRSFDELAQTDDSADNVATISDGQIDMSDQNDNQLPDWLGSESPESESENSGLEWLNAEPATPDSEAPSFFDDDNSTLDWMSELNDEQPTASTEPASEEDIGTSPESGWLIETEEVSELAKAETPDWLTDLALSGEQTPAAESNLSWLTEEPDEPEAEPVKNIPDWLTETDPEEMHPEPVSSTELEWLTTNDEPIAEPTASSEFEWVSSVEDDEPSAEIAADVPSWLAEAAPATESLPEPVSSTEFEWLSTNDEPIAEPTATGEFDWMASTEDEEADAEIVADAPDWLGEIAPSLENTQAEAEPVIGSDFEWLASDEGLAEEPETEIAADVPDWLAQAAPAAEAQPEAVTSTEFEWLSSDEDQEPEAEIVTDSPDWLGELAPSLENAQAEAEPVIGSDFEWLASDEDEEPEAEIISEAPDWLAQAAPAAEVQPEVVTSTEFEWLSSDEDQETEAEIVADAPDWLGEIAPSLENVKAEAEPVIGSDFEWLASHEDQAEEPETEIAADVPDWLAQAAPETETQPEAISSTEFEWLSSDEDQKPEAEIVADSPDWLGEIAPSFENAQAEAEPVASTEFEWLSGATDEETEVEIEQIAEKPVIGSDFEWLASDAEELEVESLADTDEEDALETAENIPDWLANASPVSEIESIEEDKSSDWVAEPNKVDFGKTRYLEEPGESEFGWLGEEESAQEAAMSEGEPEAAYAELTPDDQEALFGGTEHDEIERVMASAHAPPPAENAPDWLNAMVPGLDLDYEATEDEPLDSEYLQTTEKKQQKARDFDWLVNIVDEETGPIEPIRELADVAEAAPQRRFIFKRQPAWLRTPTERQNGEDTTNRASDDDFELPDWLQ